MIVDTTVYDSHGEPFVIVNRRLPFYSPIRFNSDQLAERFINTINSPPHLWRSELNKTRYHVNVRAWRDHSVIKQVVHALVSGSISVYRKKQLDLYQLVDTIPPHENKKLTLVIPCRWHRNPWGVRQRTHSEADARQQLSEFSAPETFWQDVIKLVGSQGLKHNATNNAEGDIARLLICGELYIHKHHQYTYRYIRQEVEPEPIRTAAPVSSLRSSPEPKPVEKTEPASGPEPDIARQIETLKRAATSGTPFCEKCEKARMKQAS